MPTMDQYAAHFADELANAKSRVTELEAVLRRVEKWWLREGMHKFDGAPECIFAVRATLAIRDTPDRK